jgi:hypothetical protein
MKKMTAYMYMCLSVTAIAYEELKIRARNFGNSFRVILRFAIANIIKIFSSAKFGIFKRY